MKAYTWIRMGRNTVLEADGYYVSHNMAENETALVINNLGVMNPYWILSGDHREEYEKRIDKLDSCIEYFNLHKDKYECTWSNPDPIPVDKLKAMPENANGK